MKTVDKNIVREGIQRITNEFTDHVTQAGFNRTKKWFWVRRGENSAEFIHLHLQGSSYGAQINYSLAFRVHFGFRAYHDKFEALALNGPHSDDPEYYKDRYHHRFNAKSFSQYERCLTDLVRFVSEVGEPWFQKQSTAVPIGGDSEQDLLAKSFKMLGLKVSK